MWAKVPSVDAAVAVAEELGISVIFDPAAQLADIVALGAEADLEEASAPPLDEPLDQFDTHTCNWFEQPNPSIPGLYRFELHQRKEFRLRQDDAWFHVDRALGQMVVLAGRNDILVWHKLPADMKQPQVLAVRSSVSLPPIAERAAVSASGLLPIWTRDWRAYRNVSVDTASRIASGLGLKLGFASRPFPNYHQARKARR